MWRCRLRARMVVLLAWTYGCGDDDAVPADGSSGSGDTTTGTTATTATTTTSTLSESTTQSDTTLSTSADTSGTSSSEGGSTSTSETGTATTDTTGSTDTGTATGSSSSSSSSASSSSTDGDGSSSGTTGMDACALGCDDEELCDPSHAGTDDDCDGVVDEECGCTAGTQQGCFMGDPADLGAPGCAPGVQSCQGGVWGPCVGGAHATLACSTNDMTSCHPLDTRPLVPASLLDGLGTFGDDAIGWVFNATCPDTESTCPLADFVSFTPLVAGEHVVTYTKLTAGMELEQCDVVVRAHKPGLNVTLEWEPDPVDGGGVDLDLVLHEPGDTSPWTVGGDAHSCAWGNCTVGAYSLGAGVSWFAGNVAPDPVDWSLSATPTDNDCTYAPAGEGGEWSMLGLGCHNPRLLTQNLGCDPAVTDPNDLAFCHAERIDLDVMPQDTWHRIAVHYYSSHGETFDVHPRVRIWCEGTAAAELGPAGFYDPEEPVTFTPTDEDTVWLVADVAVTLDECGVPHCEVAPIYTDELARTPYLATAAALGATFGPGYPPAP